MPTRGNRNECLERATSVFEAEARPARVYGEAVLGLLHLGVGELDAAIAHLETSERLLAEYGVAEIATTMALPNLIEAYARAGRTEQAWAELARLEATAERTQRTWTRACAARCRGLLTPTGFQRHFQQALELHASLPNAFDQARTRAVLRRTAPPRRETHRSPTVAAVGPGRVREARRPLLGQPGRGRAARHRPTRRRPDGASGVS